VGARPSGAAWAPLGLDSDPVPGDTDLINEQIAHLRSVAASLEAQVAALNKIAHTQDEVGKHADKLKTASSSQVGQLQTLATRYTNVSSLLSEWVPALAQAQSMSLQALNEAEGPYALIRNTPPPSGTGFSVTQDGTLTVSPGTTLTPTQQDEVSSYQSSMSRASSQLASAQALLSQAVSMRDSEGSTCASRINSTCDDNLRDHWSFSAWIHSIAGVLKDICVVLEAIAALAAIIALFVGGGWAVFLLAAAFWLTAGALVLRTVLAATGNGSWLDVAVDAFALVTLGLTSGISGAGGLFGDASRLADEGGTVADILSSTGRAEEGADDLAASADDADKFTSSLQAMTDKNAALAERFADDPIGQSFLERANTYQKALEEATSNADAVTAKSAEIAEKFPDGAEISEKAESQLTAMQKIAGPGDDYASASAKINALVKQYPESTDLLALQKTIASDVKMARIFVFTGAGVTTAGNALTFTDPKWWDDSEQFATQGV
jgi:hypothetical protein